MPDVVKKQTIKQARASFKARGRPTLSEKESRQLERAIELEQRADRAKEAEKRRLTAAKKRVEQERREHAHRQPVQLGTQRRCDRFGYKSSQFHLGAFFGKKPHDKPCLAAVSDRKQDECLDDDDLDDDLDDASLLGVLDDSMMAHPVTKPAVPQPKSLIDLMPPPPIPVVTKQNRSASLGSPAQEDFSDFFDSLDSGTQIAKALDSPHDSQNVDVSVAERPSRPQLTSQPMPPPPRPDISRGSTETVLPPSLQEDLSDFFEDLASCTQIARELDQEPREARRASNASGSSFGSGSLDLTEEDMEMIDPPTPSEALSASLATTASWLKSARRPCFASASNSTNSNSPPIVPARPTSVQPPTLTKRPPTAPSVLRKAMPPPTLPVRRPQVKITNSTQRADLSTKQQASAIRGPFLPASSLYCSPNLGFTSTQLESFIDDDLQLTQVG